MAQLPKYSNAAANAAATALLALLNTGYLRIYTTPKPADANTALSGQTLLAELRFNATAFGAPSGGVATANAITPAASAPATGTAVWFRALESDGSTVIWDGTCGTGGLKTITAGSNANPVSLTKTAHGLNTGDTITISGATSGWAPINGTWKVTNTGANTFTIPVDSTSFGALSGSPVYSDSDMDMNSTSIVAGAAVSVSSLTYTQSEG